MLTVLLRTEKTSAWYTNITQIHVNSSSWFSIYNLTGMEDDAVSTGKTGEFLL